ncbi:protein of unknown function [Acidithiobacillus ferrivorans]|uniref:Uncharacterized protein n=1 Tax=Acidithiobacillus ferrivorans TaxID=160808 RepID=A0A060UU17_9PROT|nr:hypothetical protein AFERRI_600121 [Acidithiobacillus ferrivorans]SMH65449.1 protein of unknown function [Acidithiobacillus ferrivorans]
MQTLDRRIKKNPNIEDSETAIELYY